MTCSRCGARRVVAGDATTLVACPSCKALLVSAAATQVSLLTRGPSGSTSSPIQLSAEFLDRWRLDRVLGSGAMGTVYLGQDMKSGASVAIKFLSRLGDEAARARFILEGRLLASIVHPNVLAIRTVDEVDGYPFLVTDYIEGGTLRALLGDGPLPWERAVGLASDVLDGIQACHERGVVHRDLKPENVLVGTDGRARVIDLGVAKTYGQRTDLATIGPARASGGSASVETMVGALIGTPRYMSPEQARGEPVVVASDLHAVGVMLYELLTGQPPYTSNQLNRLLRQITEGQAPAVTTVRPDVPPAIAAVVAQALAKRADRRPPGARDMANALRRAMVVATTGLPVRPPRTLQGWLVPSASILGVVGFIGAKLASPEIAMAITGLGILAVIAIAALRKAQSAGLVELVQRPHDDEP